MSVLLSLLKARVSYSTWPTQLLYLSSVGSRQGSFYYVTRVAQVEKTGNERPVHTIEADLALSLLYVNKVLFQLVLECIVFLGNSDTKMQWTGVFKILLWNW